jgi:hypothetical protein
MSFSKPAAPDALMMIDFSKTSKFNTTRHKHLAQKFVADMRSMIRASGFGDYLSREDSIMARPDIDCGRFRRLVKRIENIPYDPAVDGPIAGLNPNPPLPTQDDRSEYKDFQKIKKVELAKHQQMIEMFWECCDQYSTQIQLKQFKNNPNLDFYNKLEAMQNFLIGLADPLKRNIKSKIMAKINKIEPATSIKDMNNKLHYLSVYDHDLGETDAAFALTEEAYCAKINDFMGDSDKFLFAQRYYEDNFGLPEFNRATLIQEIRRCFPSDTSYMDEPILPDSEYAPKSTSPATAAFSNSAEAISNAAIFDRRQYSQQPTMDLSISAPLTSQNLSILNSITGTLKALNDKVDGLSAQVLSPMKEGARPRSPSVTSDKTVYSNGGRGYKRTKRGPFVPNAAKPAGGGK